MTERYAMFLPLMIAACSPSTQAATPPSPAAAEQTDKRPLVIGWKDEHYGEGISVVIDTETGCEYLRLKMGFGEAVTPRLNGAGKPLCRAAPKDSPHG